MRRTRTCVELHQRWSFVSRTAVQLVGDNVATMDCLVSSVVVCLISTRASAFDEANARADSVRCVLCFLDSAREIYRNQLLSYQVPDTPEPPAGLMLLRPFSKKMQTFRCVYTSTRQHLPDVPVTTLLACIDLPWV